MPWHNQGMRVDWKSLRRWVAVVPSATLFLLAVASAAACGNAHGEGGGELPDGGGGDGSGSGGDGPCPTGAVCECAVSTQATDCGTHEICDFTSGPGRSCACAPAYAKDGSGACAFAGAPADPGLVDPTKWTVTDGVTVDPTSAGNADPGEAIFTGAGMCGYAAVSQTFTMPPLDRAEPLKLVVTHSGTQLVKRFDLSGALLSIGVGSQWFDVPVQPSVYRTDSICLGAAAYGGPVQFKVGVLPAGNLFCGPGAATAATVKVDQLQVRVADPGECPAVGSVLDGDFEGATGWTFDGFSSGAGAYVAGVGEGATKAAQLTGTNKCSSATMTGSASFPTRATVANPAIDLYWQGSSGEPLVFQIGGKNVATLRSNGNAGHSRICVPAWAVGSVQSIGLAMQTHSGNECTTAYAQSFTIDNLTFVNEPSCTATGDLTDPGFERVANLSGPVTGWGLTQNYVNNLQGLFTNVSNSKVNAHTGNGLLNLQWDNECTTWNIAGADLTLIVPPADATGGPAVKFFASAAAANTLSDARLSLLPLTNGGTTFVVAPRTGAYTAQTLCLPPALIGRRVTLRASLGVSGGGCATNPAPETASFDDFSLATDATCPTK